MQYLERIHSYRKQIFLGLIVSVLLMFATYVYLVNQTIMHVVAREDAEIVLADMSAEVGALELSLINTRGEITLAYAKTNGFVESSDTVFLAKSDTEQKLSFANN